MQAANTVGRWSTALGQAGAEAEAARAELGSVYWYPVYAYLRAAGFDAAAGAARTESVLARFIEESPPAGEGTLLLRDWLRSLATRELTEQTLREPVLKLPSAWAENRFNQETPRAPDETFARRWTLGLIEGALAALEEEYRASGRAELFAAAQTMLGFTGGAQGDENYANLAGQLQISEGAARKGVFELRSRYREILHASIADTVANPDQISSELSSLLVELPPATATTPPRSVLRRVNAEELLARGMNSVKMSTAGGLGWTAPTVAEAGRLFPGFEVIAMLGHGGMGAVYQARQTSLDRLVAIKLLPLEISVDASFADRFRREARAMAKLNHPNIVAVHDFGQTPEGHLFIVMEFVDGAMLHDLIHQPSEGITTADSLAIVEQVCDALAYAHEQGVVHRDIKPANVMVDRRMRAKVADFGLARLTDPASKEEWGMTMTGIVMGTPDYMAPEQKRGMHVDHRADIYSVGVMLYEMLCKETPQGAFELPSARCGIDARIDKIITKALATQPERRYQNTLELKTAVQAVRPSVASPAQPRAVAPAPAEPLPREARAVARKSNGMLIGSVAAGVLATVALVVFVATRDTDKKTAAEIAAERAASASSTPPATPTPAPRPPEVIASAPVPPPLPPPPPSPAAARTQPAAELAGTQIPGKGERSQPVAPPAPPPVAEKPAVNPIANPPANPATDPGPKAAAEVVQWVAENEATFAAQWQKEAIEPFEAAVNQLRASYVGGLERNVASQSRAGKLDDALAWRNEKARLDAGQAPHEIEDDPKEPQALRQFRGEWRKSFARLDAERFARAKAVHARFDGLLEKAQTGYTQRQRFDDALLAKTKREEITKAWLTPPAQLAPSANVSPAIASKPPSGSALQPLKPGDALLSGREAIVHLRSIGFYVTYRDEDGVERTITHNDKVESIPARGRFEVTALATPGLRRIDGNGGPITDTDFAKLGPMRSLRVVEIKAASDVTGASLSFLSGSPDLETAHFSTWQMTEAALLPILGHRKVKTLVVSAQAGRFDYAKLAEALFLGELEQLTLGGLSGNDAFVAAVPKMRKLRSVTLEHAGELSATAVSSFAALPNLEHASFSGLSASAAGGLAAFEKTPKLARLELKSCDAYDALAFIGKTRKLEHLTIDGDDAPGLASAAGAPALRAIEFFHQGALTDDRALTTIAKAFPRLESLHLGEVIEHPFTPAGVRALAGLPKLTTLAWPKKPVPREILAEFAALPHLLTLDINGTGLTNEDLAPLVSSKTISTLILLFNDKITSGCAEQLKGMAKLRVLRVYSTGVKSADLPGMQKILPRVTIHIN